MSRCARSTTVVLVALYRYQNFPIRILHALLEKIDGVEPHTIFFKNYYTNAFQPPTAVEEKLFKNKIRELNPQLVGFSVYSPYASIAGRLTGVVKANSTAQVVWGGIHPTLSPETCIKGTDILCVGEGEGALSDLVRALSTGENYRHIANLWTKDKGLIYKNPMRPLVQELDAIPFPAYARASFYFIGSDKITCQDPMVSDPILAIMPARGCPFRCAFCVNSLLHPMFKHLGPFSRRRSVGNVIAELKEVLRIAGNKKKMVEFHDENFGTDESWLIEFESRYPHEVALPFKVQYNPTLIKAATIARLAKCGLHRVKFGIEAGTDHIRNQVFKRTGKNKDIVKLAQKIAGYNVKIRYDLIIDNPYDGVETLKDTFELLRHLPKPLRFNLYSLQYFPGYPLTQRALADGHISEKEASLDNLQERMARHWEFVPRPFPLTKKQILQNIIWLYVFRSESDEIIQRAVFEDSLKASICLHYLNFKAVFLGRIKALRRLMHHHPFRSADNAD